MNSTNNQPPIPSPQGSWNQGAAPSGGATWVAGSHPQIGTEQRLDFIRKTYVLLLAGILTTIVAGGLVLNIAPLYDISVSILRMPLLAVGLIFGGSIAAQAMARTRGLDYVGLFGFTGLMGFLFGPLIALYAPQTVTEAAVLSTVAFGALTAYAFITRKDFSFMGGMLMVGAITMVICVALNAFVFRSDTFGLWTAWLILFVSSGFILYKTSNMINRYVPGQECFAALSLFISFFNMFLSILSILSGGRRR